MMARQRGAVIFIGAGGGGDGTTPASASDWSISSRKFSRNELPNPALPLVNLEPIILEKSAPKSCPPIGQSGADFLFCAELHHIYIFLSSNFQIDLSRLVPRSPPQHIHHPLPLMVISWLSMSTHSICGLVGGGDGGSSAGSYLAVSRVEWSVVWCGVI